MTESTVPHTPPGSLRRRHTVSTASDRGTAAEELERVHCLIVHRGCVRDQPITAVLDRDPDLAGGGVGAHPQPQWPTVTSASTRPGRPSLSMVLAAWPA